MSPPDMRGLIELDGQLLPDYDSYSPTIEEGRMVRGTIISEVTHNNRRTGKLTRTAYLVELPSKADGLLPEEEVSLYAKQLGLDPQALAVGSEVAAIVQEVDGPEGLTILSLREAAFELAWERIEQRLADGEPVTAQVTQAVNGGLLCQLYGRQAFMPASQVDLTRVADLSVFVGSELAVRIIETERERDNIVVSRRKLLEEEHREEREAAFARLNVGDVYETTVSNVTKFGLFVDLGGIQGLVHISEMSWSHIEHPGQLYQAGQMVLAEVVSVERERQRVSLSMKRLVENPWVAMRKEVGVGTQLTGVVTKTVTYGAFVKLDAYPSLHGLVHISALSEQHVENVEDIVQVGEAVTVFVTAIDDDREQLALSLRIPRGLRYEDAA